MNKELVRSFFDRYAPIWDEEPVAEDWLISKILDHARMEEGVHVLDVACGTGVLFPWYQQRKVASVTGIDLSEEMIKIAQGKFPENTCICGDAENYDFLKAFDRIMVYNALPHFANPQALIENLTKFLAPGGILSIAHGISREKLNQLHSKHASQVSVGLISIEELEEAVAPYASVILKVSDDNMYQLVAVRSL